MRQTISFLLLFFVFSFVFRSDPSFDQDLGRHIKLGEIIVNTRGVPTTNLFSYTNPDFPFINTHWLFEALVYFFSQSLGLQTLLFLKVIIFLLSIWLIFQAIPKDKQIFLLPIGFIFLHVLRERLELRPEIFSFLFTASTYFILEKFVQTSSGRGTFVAKLIWILPLIQLIWINTHIYFFVGLMLQAIFLLHIWISDLLFHSSSGKAKVVVIIFVLSLLFSLINPNGLNGFLYPLNVTKNYGYTIVENQTMYLLESINFKNPNFIFVKLCWGIIILSLIIAIIKRNFSIKNIFLAITGLVLSLMNVRSFPYLVFLSLPTTVINFSLLKIPKVLNNLILTIFTAMILLESFSYLNGEYYKSHDSNFSVGLSIAEKGKNALNFLINNDLPNPIFNNFDIGSYIIYRGFPRFQVFVDGRPEAYPKEFFQNIYIPMQSDYSKFKTEEQKRGFKTVIFSHTDQTPWGISFLGNIVKDSSWKLVFIDDFMVIFVKNETVLEKKLEIIDLARLDPQNYKYDNHVSFLRLGLFLFRNNYPQASQKFIEKANAVLTSGKNIRQ